MNIDVIIPTFNRAELVVLAIDSVLAQSYQNFLLHIVDDGSTDNTQALLSKYSQNPKINIHHIQNGGVAHSRNYGIKNSQNEWICFLDSDDEWLPQKLEKQVHFLSHNSQYEFAHTEEIWIRNGVRVNPKTKHSKASDDLFKRSLEFCLISPSTVMMKRSLFQKYGPFEEEHVVCEDYDLWIKILAHEDVGYIPEALVNKYGGHEDQLSSKYFAMDYWRIKSLVNLYGSNVNQSQKDLIIDVLKRKSEILLKGYQKHQNLLHFEEIQNLLKGII
jgi:glycosyltransferase involved in cell wall biosynthesis